eukprot:jgi/Mesen1/6176/ME000032S05468
MCRPIPTLRPLGPTPGPCPHTHPRPLASHGSGPLCTSSSEHSSRAWRSMPLMCCRALSIAPQWWRARHLDARERARSPPLRWRRTNVPSVAWSTRKARSS